MLLPLVAKWLIPAAKARYKHTHNGIMAAQHDDRTMLDITFRSLTLGEAVISA
jgi:hypothetical protein